MPTPAEQQVVEEALPAQATVPEPDVGERTVRIDRRARARSRHHLLPVLHAVQAHIGYVSPGAVNHIGRLMGLPPAEIYGVATFYDLLRVEDVVEHPADRFFVCGDYPCWSHAAELTRQLTDGGAEVVDSHCLGQCDHAPGVFVQGCGSPDRIGVDPAAPPPSPTMRQRGPLTSRVGVVDPTSLDDYVAAGGFTALRTAIDVGPDEVLARLARQELRGRGGAAFPTAAKWETVRSIESVAHHLIVNADESEPGSFKDRALMEGDPFALVEGAAIAAYVCGVELAWIYIRGEYPIAVERVTGAVAAARDAGYLQLAGIDDVEIRRGAGAYVCGEETALIRSIEGYRGEPQQKPPFPVHEGLFGEPTVVNNVETLVNVPVLVTRTEPEPLTRLFSVYGAVAEPGVYEARCDTTVAGLVSSAGGEIGEVDAVLLGGAAGSFVGPSDFDRPLSDNPAVTPGPNAGAGSVLVVDGTVDMAQLMERITHFFVEQSCGQCVPCRVGTVRQHEALVRLTGGPDRATTTDLIGDVGAVMVDASICGFGPTATTAVASALRLGLI